MKPLPIQFWLMKSEPDVYSINHLKQDKKTYWDGVRNYQARKFMRDQMKAGDLVLFYHSNAEPPGVAGIAQVRGPSRPEPKDPTWVMADLKFVEKFPHFVSLDELRQEGRLQGLLVLKRGQRLSVQPVSKEHFELIQKMGHKTS